MAGGQRADLCEVLIPNGPYFCHLAEFTVKFGTDDDLLHLLADLDVLTKDKPIHLPGAVEINGCLLYTS